MAHDTRAFVPRLNPACNVRALPITPADAFVLSRVDGFTSANDIGLITGMGEAVLETLERLHKLGALVDGPSGGGPSPDARNVPPRASAQPAASPTPPPRNQPPAVRLAPTTNPTPIDPKTVEAAGLPAKIARYPASELEEDVDIEPDRRKRILDLFYALSDLTHYDLLGVPSTAEKKQIKAAYFQLAQEFHPDRYFRKQVGNFKPKLEAIFKQVTEAHDVLTRAATRALYDADLESRPQPQPRDGAKASPSTRPPARVPTPSPSASAAVATPAPSPSPPPASPPPASPTPAPPPAAASAPRPEVTPSVLPTVGPEPRPMTPEEERARRQALAQRLSSGRFQAATRGSSDSPPPAGASAPPAMGGDAAMHSLRRMAAARQVEAGRSQLDRYLRAAEEAADRNDAVAAANSYRLALSMAPGDAMLEQTAREWSQKAAATLAAAYVKQGDAELEQGRWAEAARCFARAVQGAPVDAALLEKAAIALVKAEGDLHQAADFARRAVALSPNNVRFRLALAEVYLAAKLSLNARRELEAAAKIDPTNAKVKVLLKQLA